MSYVKQVYRPKMSIIDDLQEKMLFLEKHEEFISKNYKRHIEFYNKLCLLKENNQLRSFDSLTSEEFYDLRVSMGIINNEILNLFKINKHQLSKAIDDYQVYCDARQYLSEIIFGIREIDVDKFVEHLSV